CGLDSTARGADGNCQETAGGNNCAGDETRAASAPDLSEWRDAFACSQSFSASCARTWREKISSRRDTGRRVNCWASPRNLLLNIQQAAEQRSDLSPRRGFASLG